MKTFVALLRGINVGGNAKVEMPRLKALFAAQGCQNVSTYINTGNVIFQDQRSWQQLVPLLEAELKKEFGFELRIVLRERHNIEEIVKAVPAAWTNDKQQKTDVLFMWPEIDKPDIKDKIVVNQKIERILFVPGAFVWNIGRENVTKGNGVKLVKTDLYKYLTVRNINTVRKIAELMNLLD
jgi:uncharacterized protein (DUF1697 family)